MKLNNEAGQRIKRGVHFITVRANGGTVSLLYSVEGLDYAPLPDSVYTVDTDEIKTLCKCDIKAVLTGGAQVYINLATQ